jgi:hypothetical protein
VNKVEQDNHNQAHMDAVHNMNLYNVEKEYSGRLEKQVKEWRNIAYQFYKNAMQSKTNVLLAEKTLSVDECINLLDDMVVKTHKESK